MKDYFSFSHNYYKLLHRCFTTIRGASTASQYREGQEVNIIQCTSIPSNGTGIVLGKARIVMIETIAIEKISIDVLKDDAEFPGFTVRTAWDFVGLINSFRKYEKSKIKSLETKVAIFYLEKIA
jgi:hypothetical protein